jgi:ribonuclease P protein component
VVTAIPSPAAAHRTARLTSAADIRAVFATRSVAHGRAVVAHARDRGDEGAARATVVAGRRVGDAVRRNRAKRRIRAALAGVVVPPGTDLVLVARSEAGTAAFEDLCEQVAAGVRSAAAKARR